MIEPQVEHDGASPRSTNSFNASAAWTERVDGPRSLVVGEEPGAKPPALVPGEPPVEPADPPDVEPKIPSSVSGPLAVLGRRPSNSACCCPVRKRSDIQRKM